MQTNEVTERGRTYRMKRGILKMHEENQSPTYEYWRTVIPDDSEDQENSFEGIALRAVLRAPGICAHPGGRQDQLLSGSI